MPIEQMAFFRCLRVQLGFRLSGSACGSAQKIPVSVGVDSCSVLIVRAVGISHMLTRRFMLSSGGGECAVAKQPDYIVALLFFTSALTVHSQFWFSETLMYPKFLCSWGGTLCYTSKHKTAINSSHIRVHNLRSLSSVRSLKYVGQSRRKAQSTLRQITPPAHSSAKP